MRPLRGAPILLCAPSASVLNFVYLVSSLFLVQQVTFPASRRTLFRTCIWMGDRRPIVSPTISPQSIRPLSRTGVFTRRGGRRGVQQVEL